MQKKSIRYGIVIFILGLLFFLQGSLTTVFAQSSEKTGDWRLDAPAESSLPRNFRKSSDPFQVVTSKDPSRQGLDWLRISGSGQPSEKGLTSLFRRIREESMAAIYLVDLRQESHGYFNGTAVSWHEENNWGNRGDSSSVVLKKELVQLQAEGGHTLTISPMGREDLELYQPVSLTVRTVQTEKDAAEKAGFHYVRIAATDQVWPEPQAIDAFMAFYKNLPNEPVWLHFHCQAGHGRTTIFMTLYDILRNPTVSLETIVSRQQLIGGTNGLQLPATDETGWRAAAMQDKAKKLQLFYRYVQEQYPGGFVMSWSEWLKNHQGQ